MSRLGGQVHGERIFMLGPEPDRSGRFLPVKYAGGIHSPLACGALNADMAEDQGMPALLAAAGRLGTVNHNLLTIEAPRMRGLVQAGIILNQPSPQMDPAMGKAQDLERWRQMPGLRMPYGSGWAMNARRPKARSLSPLAAALLIGTSAEAVGR